MNKDSRLLRIGVLGCGPIAQIAHCDAVRKARNTELHAICDVADDLRERVAAVHSPRVAYRAYEEMLADPQVEAVIIAVADQFHVPLAAQALTAKKHVLVEKPLGVSLEECEALRVTARQSGCVLQVGHNRRFDPGLVFARQFVREQLGQMLSFKGWYYDSIHRYTMTDNLHPLVQESTQARRPRGRPKDDKRRYFLLTHGSHLVDTARYLAGEILSVRARFRETCGAHCWFADLALASGALGHLDLTIPVRGDFEEGFQIQGEHGSVQGRSFLPWFHKSSLVECFSTKDGQYHRPMGEDAHTYRRQIEGFAETILHHAQQHGANIDDGVAAIRALVAIARSEESGASVRLAEVTGPV